MKKYRILMILAALLLVVCTPVLPARAAIYTFESDFVDAEIADHTLVMTSQTSKYDEVWKEAGVSDVTAKIDEFRTMNIMAYFYNKDTMQGVNVIRNNTQETVDAFSFAQMSESEILAFAKEVGSASGQEGITVDVSVLNDVAEFPCFRLFIDARNTANPCSEVVYGIVMNAQIFQFDSFTDGTGEPNEDYLKEIIGGFHWTKQLTRGEYEDMVRDARIKLVLISVGFVAIIGGLIALAVLRRRSRNKRNKTITAKMTEFREKKANGEITPTQPLFFVSTKYDEALFNDYATYAAWIRPALSFVISIVFLAAVLILMVKGGSYMYGLFMFVIIVILLYMHYTQTEKLKESLIKRYDVKSHPAPTFRFYKEYFEVSGLRSAGQYIYGQITALRSYKNSVYLFVGDDTVLIIRKEDITEEQIAKIKELM